MPAKLLTLEQWIARRYDAGAAPAIGTVRRWAKSGKLCPRPVREGRGYRISEDAVYGESAEKNIEQPPSWQPDFSVLGNIRP